MNEINYKAVYDKQSAAQACGVSAHKITRAVNSGDLKAMPYGDRNYRIMGSALVCWLESGRAGQNGHSSPSTTKKRLVGGNNDAPRSARDIFRQQRQRNK